MYFHIMDKNNEPVISGELVLMRPHTSRSEIEKTLCFLVYMHEVEINPNSFPEWAEKHLKVNHASGSGGKHAGSEHDYIEFSLGAVRDDYDFLIAKNRHQSKSKRN